MSARLGKNAPLSGPPKEVPPSDIERYQESGNIRQAAMNTRRRSTSDRVS
jgi:hypothetical protein